MHFELEELFDRLILYENCTKTSIHVTLENILQTEGLRWRARVADDVIQEKHRWRHLTMLAYATGWVFTIVAMLVIPDFTLPLTVHSGSPCHACLTSINFGLPIYNLRSSRVGYTEQWLQTRFIMELYWGQNCYVPNF